MGLDMYLEKDIYVGAHYEHLNASGVIDITVGGRKVPINLSRLSSVTERAGYWRKANQVHAWFVQNVQDGADDCKRYYVDTEKLQELRTECLKALETRNTDGLPPKSGFFFGSTEVDEWYWKHLEDTVKIIDGLDPGGEYYYRASW